MSTILSVAAVSLPCATTASCRAAATVSFAVANVLHPATNFNSRASACWLSATRSATSPLALCCSADSSARAHRHRSRACVRADPACPPIAVSNLTVATTRYPSVSSSCCSSSIRDIDATPSPAASSQLNPPAMRPPDETQSPKS
eukprot:scaffold5149_cov71-Phaeocystis_antarctica.AAC.5